jgi:type II secretory pathway pseudopilin PulG
MALLLATALILIALTAGLPVISTELRRQREEELIHRGVAYTRAIRNYYRKFGTYPLSLDQLEEANHMRFLRNRYKDPITGSDFRLLHLGEVQLTFRPIAQPGAAAGAASSTNGSGTGGVQSSNNSTSPSPLVSPSQMGATGGEFGGGPIMGVASTSEKQSFHVFNDKDHYKDWLFVYSPALEQCGGLFTRPFDGIQPSRNCAFPTAPMPTPTVGGGAAPGVQVPPKTH